MTEPLEIQGFASIFGNIDKHGDIVVKGAFSRSIREGGPKVPLFWEHDHSSLGSGLPIGHTTHLEETDRGLFFRGLIVPTAKGADVASLVRAGSVTEASFAFGILDKEIDSDGVRILKDLDLQEISVVTWGANPDTSVEVVNSAPISAVEDIEHFVNALDMVSTLKRLDREIQRYGY